MDELFTQIEVAIIDKTTINETKNFTYSKVEKTLKERKTDNNVTTCRSCMNSCHLKCVKKNDEEKKYCIAMDDSGNCKICIDHCPWDKHVNTHIIHYYDSVTKTYTLDDLKKKYDTAKTKYTNHELLIKDHLESMKNTHNTILKTMIFIREKNEELDKDALLARPHDTTKFFVSLINQEETEKKNGYVKRIKTYTEMMELAKLVEKIRNAKDLNKLMPERAIQLLAKLKEEGFQFLMDELVDKYAEKEEMKGKWYEK